MWTRRLTNSRLCIPYLSVKFRKQKYIWCIYVHVYIQNGCSPANYQLITSQFNSFIQSAHSLYFNAFIKSRDKCGLYFNAFIKSRDKCANLLAYFSTSCIPKNSGRSPQVRLVFTIMKRGIRLDITVNTCAWKITEKCALLWRALIHIKGWFHAEFPSPSGGNHAKIFTPTQTKEMNVVKPKIIVKLKKVNIVIMSLSTNVCFLFSRLFCWMKTHRGLQTLVLLARSFSTHLFFSWPKISALRRYILKTSFCSWRVSFF